MQFRFSPFLFSTDSKMIQKTAQAGVEAIVVDWEEKGK